MAADQAKNEAQKAADEEIEEAQITADKAHKAAAEAQKAADEAFEEIGISKSGAEFIKCRLLETNQIEETFLKC